MAGAAIAIDDAAAADTILSVKQRVFAANPKLFVRRQRLVYCPGPRGMDALADDETLGGACVARDGSAELDVLVADLTAAEAAELGEKVYSCLARIHFPFSCSVVIDLVINVTIVTYSRNSFSFNRAVPTTLRACCACADASLSAPPLDVLSSVSSC